MGVCYPNGFHLSPYVRNADGSIMVDNNGWNDGYEWYHAGMQRPFIADATYLRQ